MSSKNEACFHRVFLSSSIFSLCKTHLPKRSSDNPTVICSNFSRIPEHTPLTPCPSWVCLGLKLSYSHVRKQFLKLLLRIRKPRWNKRLIRFLFRSTVFQSFILLPFSFLRQAIYSLQCFWWWFYLLDLSWRRFVYESNKKGAGY